jgi:hypothetical protein
VSAFETGEFKDEVLRVFGDIRKDIEKVSRQIDDHKEGYNREMTSLKVEVATLKLKLSFMAGFYGILGGAIPAVIGIVLHFAK